MRLQGFKKYGIGAAGMLALVVAIVLATGSGSAVAAQITSVFVTNDVSHPVPVHEQGTANVQVTNLPTTQAVSGSVNVGNFPAAPTTSVVANATGTYGGSGSGSDFFTPLPQTDVHQYRSVTLYLVVTVNTSNGFSCQFITFDPLGNFYQLDSVTFTDNFFTKTIEPAPPNLRVNCANNNVSGGSWRLMLTGRTG